MPIATSTESIWVCPACGANYPAAPEPPPACPICQDERQWVPPDGQRWVTMEQLADQGYCSDTREVEPGLMGIGVRPSIGVGQRALLVRTSAGNLLWDPPAFIDAAAVEAVRAAGGLAAVSSSHPHMYGAIAQWSEAFDAEMVLPEVDLEWLTFRDGPVRAWSEALEVLPGVSLVQCGGHFPGSAVVHWAAGAEGRGVLLCGDTLFVTPGEDRVSFIWSAPNRLPLPERDVRRIVAALAPYAFDRIYGGWWSPVLRREAKPVLQRSAERYIQVLRGE